MAEKHHLHVEIPQELWDEFKNVVPESGVTSLIIKRLLKAYVEAAKNARDTIDLRKLVI